MDRIVWDVVFSRHNGVLIPRWQWGRFAPIRGCIYMEHKTIQKLNRSTMIALLASGDARYELWDAQCIRMSSTYLVLSGYSREHDKTTAEVDYAQTWVMKLAGTDDTDGRHAAGVT